MNLPHPSLRFPGIIFSHLVAKRDSESASLARIGSMSPKPHRDKTKDGCNSSQNRSAHATAQDLEHLLSKYGKDCAQNATDTCQWCVC